MAKLSVDQTLSKAKSYAKKGEIEEAQKLYQSVLQAFPKNGRAQKGLDALIQQHTPTTTQNPPQELIHRLLGYYQNGRFNDAEKLAVFMTQEFPRHQFAWKVFGAVLGATGRKSEAAIANQTAVTLLPEDAAAHNNLGNTLQELGRFDDALISYKRAIALKPEFAEAQSNLGSALKELGRFDEAEASYKRAIALKPDFAMAHSNLGNTLHELGRFDEAETSYTQAIALNPAYAEAHNNLGNTLKELGRFDEAQTSYTQAIVLKPDFVEAHSNLGNTLHELGKFDDAEASYKRAIALKPDFAMAYNNLGSTLQELERLDHAEASYKRAIALKPDYAEAYSNLGNTLHELARLDEAETSHNQAIALKPNYAEAHSNLGNTLKELGRLDEALASYTQAIVLKPDFAEAYVNLGITVKDIRFNSSNPKLYPTLTQLLTTGNFARPKDVASSVLNLLKHDIQIKDLLLKKNFDVSLNEAISIIETLDKFPLLHHLMRVCPLPELNFEKLFVAMRSLLLKNLDKIEVCSELIYFLSTLSIHCFTNEYVYIESDEESHLIGELQARIAQTVAQSDQPELIEILCLASYRPLHQYDWCQRLESLDNLEEVKKRLIEEPLLEQMIAKEISASEEISDDVSLKVREQYEENPYPRWVKIRVAIKAKPIAAVCDEVKLKLYSENIKNVTAPSILIAGCGTGQHSIGTASRFSNSDVTAVDLSLSSLAYAKRKTDELGFSNIDYLHADILHLHQLGKEFDIVESAGVLHHMDEPMAGWRILVDLLNPGGLMKIGLYSELARQHIVDVRKEIASLGIGTSATEIRNFRELSTESEIHDVKQLSTFSDFFSLSEFRDLVFHVQEHRFTLPQIKNSLDELGLQFCGFENNDSISNFRELHGNEADIYNLELWHQFEKRNRQAFAGMYQFWCQKR